MKKFIFTGFFLLFSFIVQAQNDAAELAKKLANPIAALILVPFQNNTDYGIGELNGTRNTLNFQPVIPIGISKDMNMITRLVLPIVTQYNVTGVGEKQNGFGDALVSAFFSPVNAENLTWGVGPAFLIPTGTNNFLTTKKFGFGPTAVALKQVNGWTIGGLINQIWSIAGSEERPDVSQMFVQPFVVFNWKTGAGAGANLEWTQNWKAGTSTIWLNPTISAVTSLGKQKTQFVIGPRLNLAAPDGFKADWGWRGVIIFLFPK